MSLTAPMPQSPDGDVKTDPAEADLPALIVYAVWHPESQQAAILATSLFKTLCANPDFPASRGLGIPVRFRTTMSGAEVPRPIPFTAAQRVAVFVFADDLLVSSPEWRVYVDALTESASPSHWVVPVTMTDPRNLPPALGRRQAIRLEDRPGDRQEQTLLNHVMNDLCRFLDTQAAKVKVFLSHAKHDGVEITTAVRRHLREAAHLEEFFDTSDIPDGADFADILRQRAGALAALLAVQTDTYASREWCRLEVLAAKRHHVSIVVLSAVERVESRAFPYIGNVPVVRWRGDESLEALVGVLLYEVLRNRYFPLRVKAISRDHPLLGDDQVVAYPPELVTVLAYRAELRELGQSLGRIIYPDPPLGTEELEILRDFAPDLEPITPTLLQAT